MNTCWVPTLSSSSFLMLIFLGGQQLRIVNSLHTRTYNEFWHDWVPCFENPLWPHRSVTSDWSTTWTPWIPLEFLFDYIRVWQPPNFLMLQVVLIHGNGCYHTNSVDMLGNGAQYLWLYWKHVCFNQSDSVCNRYFLRAALKVYRFVLEYYDADW